MPPFTHPGAIAARGAVLSVQPLAQLSEQLASSPLASLSSGPGAWVGALLVLALLLTVGTGLGRLLGSRSWGVPEALIAGSIGLLLAPDGPLPLLPVWVLAVWRQLPLILLTLVFGTLLVGKPLPRPDRLWRPLSAQLLLALTLAFGQYLVAALTTLALASRLPGIHPLMACLIEVAYEGGHGSAAAMGPTYARLGFGGGEDLGLAMATVGLLSSTVLGGLVVVLARRAGWLLASGPMEPSPLASSGAAATPAESSKAPAAAVGATQSGDRAGGRGVAGALGAWAVNLGLAGAAVAIGWLALSGLQLLAGAIGGGFEAVIAAFPVFPLAIIGSLLVRLGLERSGLAHWASSPIQGLTAALAADLLITAATACLDLSLLAHDWIPLTALALAGLIWNLGVVLLLGPRILPGPWFERGILEFGQATGVAASGLLLLRMADPEDHADALPAFSIKQLMLQPLIAGGVITVLAPLAITRLGLPLWSGVCLLLVLLWSGLALLLARRGAPA